MTEGFFRIPAYQSSSARLVIDSLKAPVNMLWLHTQSVNNITGEPALHATAWDELPGHHFLYKIGIQPQVEMVDGQKSWYPSFELEFTLSDFLTLHSLLLKFKQLHQSYLGRQMTEASTTTLTELSGGLCFELDYALTKRNQPDNEGHLTPACMALKVFHMASGQRTNIGTFKMFGAVTGMTGLLLEAERINAILNGEDADAVGAIKQMPFTRASQSSPPPLRIV